MTDKKQKTGLELLREAFPAHQISKLPKPNKAQTDAVRADFKKGIRCNICGAWHHPDVIHLDYVGHAALTDRLLDCDPEWNWEPVATAEDGSPKFDSVGGMWIRLTVCGVTRLGYGHAGDKRGGDAIKEIIGDAMRNAAMRFGAALDLWHKGDLHADDETQVEDDKPTDDETPTPVDDRNPPPPDDPFEVTAADIKREVTKIGTITDMDELASYWRVLVKAQSNVAKHPEVIAAKDEKKAALS